MKNFHWIQRTPLKPRRLSIRPRLEFLEDKILLAVNAILAENQLPGTDPGVWMINGVGDTTLQGFSTDISTNVGGTISFKINDTTKAAYSINIYRIGYYNGDGARLVSTVPSSQTLDQIQPAPLTNTSTGLVDAGNWSVSASWTVPSNAVSGVYVAEPTRTNGNASMIVFVVRNDASHSDILYKTDDATWEAYNDWGGNDLYLGGPATNPPRADAVSYNRPLNNYGDTSETNIHDQLFYAEFPMISFLEENGYDVSYSTDVDTDRYGSLIENHKVFMSAGHDEYWSGNEFHNIMAARDAGVNMAFFTGNEAFWKTYYQPSIDPSATADRTIVCYKETHDNAITDPNNPSIWTGTWEDPRFSSTTDGGVGQNELTGTLFTVNQGPDATGTPITVPGADAKLRFWRNTAVASLAPDQSLAVGGQVLGYEWDSDVDNGFRPAGLIDLSSTTQNVPQVFVDYGNTVEPGTATNSQVEYRAASGALVFGAGTVQWSWGLSSDHSVNDNLNDPAPIIQQATINLFADMGNVQPGTLMTGLVAATQSTDHIPPTSVITWPPAGVTLPSGTPVTITGTATDAGGGVVAGVEVSVDGGVTWHPVQGRASWSYSWTPGATGPVTIMSRATDDSLNIETPSRWVVTTVTTPASSLTIWGLGATPGNPSAVDTTANQIGVELGVRFSSDIAGYITGIRFYKGTTNTGTHVGNLWTSTGTLLATATFSDESAAGWQEVDFASPVAITAGTSYVASYYAPAGNYAADPYYFALNGANSGPLHVPADLPQRSASVFAYGPNSFPTGTSQSTNYWVDVVFSPTAVVSPRASSVLPLPNAGGISSTTPITATFNESVQPGSISFTLKDSQGNAVPATLAYDGTTHTAKLTPNGPLNYPATYTATLGSAADPSGNQLQAPVTWTFNTSYQPGTAYSFWNNSIKPTVGVFNDNSPIEVGVQFTSSVKGTISGIRFFEGDNHIDDTSNPVNLVHLWSSTGTLLATASTTINDDSSFGWQQANFATPVAVAANTVYVASYYTPVGGYAADVGYFTNSGVTSGPLHALSTSEGNGGKFAGDGVFSYGGGFPTSSMAGTNYWVDPIFNVNSVNTPPPTVTAESPSAGSSGVSGHSPITVTFSEPVLPPSISFALTDSSANSVKGTLTYNATTNTLTFAPDVVLATGTQYTATVSGATDAFGNSMTSPVSWTFTTSPNISIWGISSVPATASVNDTSPIEVGVKFGTDVPGTITGISFYKGSGNTGAHVAHLWTSTGTLLATGTFTGETASGWQQVTFSTPVTITPDTIYIASYYAPAGGYAVNGGYFTNSGAAAGPLLALSDAEAGGNGVYRYGSGFPTYSYNAANYWVDVMFAPSKTSPTPPAIVAKSPTPAASGVSTLSQIQATFSGLVQMASIGFAVSDPFGHALAGSVTYDSTTYTATFVPTAALAVSTTYTVTIISATDLFGNSLASPVSWTFTTASVPSDTLFSNASAPAVASSGDTSPIEVGVQFQSAVPGYLAGIRFYKGAGNGGTHVGHLWNASGTLLATATFTSETASDWQQVTFAQPVAIAMGTTYVASYYAPQGGYAADAGYFSGPGLSAGPLTAANGLYAYAAGGGFPSGSYNGANYWVDVVFNPGAVNTPPPTVVSESPTPGSTGIGVLAPITAVFSEPVQPGSITFSLSDAFGQPVAGALSYNPTSNSVTFAPTGSLATGMTYTATVTGATDYYNHHLAASLSWTFTTTGTSTIWASTSAPAVASSGDASPIEVGVKFQSSQPGYIAGIRFYKGSGNGGTHIGNLWTSLGALLATATFTSETAGGWQEADFSSPVAIAPGITYVASYFAPEGDYAVTSGYFASLGTTNGPLQALSNAAAGGNGVFSYGADSFPTSSYASSNYWVDVAFTHSAGTTSPIISQTTPASNASGVLVSSKIVATLSEPVQANSIVFALTDPNGVAVPATLSYDGAYALTLTPTSLLNSSTTYKVTISGAKDYSGNVMAPMTWSFTTANTWMQSSSAFAQGNFNGTAVGSDGGLQLAPGLRDDFNGTVLSSTWSATSWQTSGTATVANGILSLSGTELVNTSWSPAAVGIEGRIAFSNAYQSFGMGTGLANSVGNYWAIFSTGGTNNTLFAQVNNNGTIQNINLGALPSGFHTYEVLSTTNAFEFLVDGTVMANLTSVFAAGPGLQAILSDYQGSPQNPLLADWGRTLGGTFTSATFDAGKASNWLDASWVATVPAGTNLIVETSSSTDGTTWSDWIPVVNGGKVASPAGRFLRYRLVLISDEAGDSPDLTSISFDWAS